MNTEKLVISINSGSIVISKGEKSFGMEKSCDNDIWFGSMDEMLELDISFYSRDRTEAKCYELFERLMKLIVGRYVLTGDYSNEFCTLPKDFINLENKTITWHSDSEKNNILQLQYSKKSIKILILKSKESFVNRVRIRTSGSNYGYYYQEFEKFFQETQKLALHLNASPDSEPIKRMRLL